MKQYPWKQLKNILIENNLTEIYDVAATEILEMIEDKITHHSLPCPICGWANHHADNCGFEATLEMCRFHRDLETELHEFYMLVDDENYVDAERMLANLQSMYEEPLLLHASTILTFCKRNTVEDLEELCNSGKKPVIRLNTGINKTENLFDAKMLTRVVGFKKDIYDPNSDPVIILETDFSEFAEYNKQFENSDFVDDNGIGCLRWHESRFYPQTLKERIYLMPSDTMFAILSEDEEQSILKYIKTLEG